MEFEIEWEAKSSTTLVDSLQAQIVWLTYLISHSKFSKDNCRIIFVNEKYLWVNYRTEYKQKSTIDYILKQII